MSTAPFIPVRRPAAVIILFGVFCITTPLYLLVYGLQLSAVLQARSDAASVPETCGAMAAFLVWFIGILRLFLLRADAWLWLLAAMGLGLPITILSFLRQRVEGLDLTLPLLASTAQYLLATGIVVYSCRLFRHPR